MIEYEPDTSAEAMAEIAHCCKLLKMPVVLWNKYRSDWEISEYSQDFEFKCPSFIISCRTDSEAHKVTTYCHAYGSFVQS